jgi:hypothetical protein
MRRLFTSRADSLLRGGTGTPRWRAWLAALALLAGLPGSNAQGQALPVTSSLYRHFKADAGIAVDGSGNVTTWADQSPNGAGLIQSGAGNRPALVAAGFGSRPTVRFDGTDDVLTSTANVDLTSELSIFVVSRNAIRKSYNGVLRVGALGSFSSQLELYYQAGTTNAASGNLIYQRNGGSAYRGSDNVPPAVGLPGIMTNVVTAANVHRLAVNGSAPAITQTNGAALLPTAADVLYLGVGYGNATGVGYCLNGDISEVIIYNRAVSAAEQTQIETYLSNKYSIATAANPTPSPSLAPVTSGLRLHLAADLGVTSGGGLVSAWADQSGNGFDATQATAGSQPTLVAASDINGRPALRFNSPAAGATDFMNNTTAALTTNGSPNTVFIVGRAPAGGNGGSPFTIRRSTPLLSYELGFAFGAFYVYSDGVNGSSNASTADLRSTIQAPFISAFRSTGPGAVLGVTVNGTSRAVSQPAGMGNETGATGYTVGTREDQPNLMPWSGDYAEVLVYNRALTAAEQTQVETYLSNKYNIPTVANPSPTSGAPTLTSFTPTSGTPGTVVTVNGTNLSGLTSISFNGTAAATYSVNAGGTQVTVTVPAAASTGAITVVNASGTANTSALATPSFTVLPAPTISSFSPTSAAAGSTVTISGTNLTGVTGVRFGGVPAASFTIVSGTSLTAVPAAAGASGPITLTYGSGSTVSSASAFTLLLPEVRRVEYFLDTDPGFGAGTSVALTAAPDVTNLSFGVNLASLSAGFHRLGVRSKDATGLWSLTTSQTFFYEPLANQAASNVVKAEYFIDTDPGFNLGTNIAIAAPGTDVAGLAFGVNLASLSPGFHRLSVRTRDANGKWSLTSGQNFFYEPLANQAASNIVKAEYFLDTDPGFNQGVNVPIATTGTDVAGLVFNVNLASLSAGFHRLSTRTRDANGKWSLTTNQTFFFEPALAQPLPNVVKAEYFLDTDPGFNLGTNIVLGTPLTDVSGIAFSVNLSSLADGFHRLSVRSKDAYGRWSLTGGQNFFYESVAALSTLPNLTRIEYFLNADPGFGLGTAVPVPANTTDAANVNIAIPIGALSTGFHTMQLRAKSANGRWSLTTVRSFYYEPLPVVAPNVVRAEYFFDNDPGFGLGTPVPVTPPAPDVAGMGIVANASALADGLHRFSVRTRDASGRWSLVTSSTFVKNGCGSSLNLAANLPAASYTQSGIWAGSAQAAFNGGGWNAGGFSGTMQADLGPGRRISEIRLTPTPSPNTNGTMTVQTSPDMVTWTTVDTYNGSFTSGVQLVRSYSATPLTNVRGLRMTFSWPSSWVSVSNVGVYDFNCSGPTITSFTPSGGPSGTSVIITGTNLTGITGVSFNGTPVTAGNITANSATSVTVVAPAGGTSGQICLTATAGSTCSAPSYTYPPIIVTGTVSPTSFCSSTLIQVPFTTNFAGYAAGNQFGFQLSDASGVFSPTSRVYGRLIYQNGSNGIVSDSVALRTPAGSGYRVRVVASSPATTGNDNGVNLTIFPTPLATAAAAPASVAYNGTINLSAGPLAQGSYQWYVRYPNGGTSYVGSGQTLSINNAQVNQSGRYFVYVTNGSGCQDSASVRVTVNPSAQPILTLSQFGGSICAGSTLGIGFAVNGNDFAGGNIITAQLSDASGSFASPTVIGSVAFSGQGNGYVNTTVPTNTPQGSSYRIRLVGSSPSLTSSGDNGANLTINALPTANASSNSPVPYGGTLQLTAQTVPGATYQWYGPGFYSTLQNPTITNATINQNAGTYQLVVSLNGCQTVATTNIAVSPSDAPILTMAQFGGGPLCAGSSSLNISFNVTGNSFDAGNVITAQLSNASGSFGAPVSIGSVSFVGQGNGVVSVSIPASTPTGAGFRIRLVGSAPGVASQTDNGSNISINTAPAAIISGNNSPVAYNGTVTLTAQAVPGATYLWSVPGVGNVNTGSTPSLSVNNAVPANSGTYILTVIVGSCSNSTTASVTVLPAGQPIVAVSQFGGSICAGSGLTIGFNVSGASFNAGTTITAQLSDASGSFAAPVAIGSTTFGGQGNGSVSATIPGGTSQGSGYRIRLVASSAATMTPTDNGANVTINALPAAIVSSNNSPVTAGGSIQLAAQVVPGATYQWVFNSSLVGTGSTLSISNAQAANAGTYTLIVTLGSCPNSTTTNVTVNTPSAALATGSFGGTFCPGSLVSVPFTAAGFNAGNVFTAQLSDAGGSFASAVNIGSLTATSSGSISAQIPVGTGSGSGYRIRVVASSPGMIGADNGQNLVVGPISYTWTGAAGNTSWFDPLNWSCGQVPTSTSVVVIPGSLTFYPVITGSTAAALNLTIQTSASFTVNTTFSLYGNVTVNGTVYAATTSTWTFAGLGNQFVYGSSPFQAGNVIINGGSILNAGNFISVYGNWTNNGSFLNGGSLYGVTFNGSGGSQCVCGSATTGFYNFTVGSGALVSLGLNTSFSGNVVVNGTFSAATYGVVLNGTVAQTLGGTGNSTFYNVTINNTVGVTLVDDITVLGNWINNGLFSGGSYSVIFAGTAAQIIGGSQVTNFYNATFNNAISVTLNQHIYVLGSFTNTGVFYGYTVVGGVTTGYWVRFGGSVAQVINANALTYFYHFYVDNLAGVSLATNIYVAGNYYLYSGSFNPGTFTINFNGTEGLVQTIGGYTALTFYGWNIGSGASVRIIQHVTLLGSFANSGIFYGWDVVAGNSVGYTCTFGGTVAQTLTGTGIYNFWHVVINNTLASVTFNTLVHLYGSWTNNGVFACGTGTVFFDGSVAQLIGGSVNTTFYHVTINNLISVTLNQAITVLGNWAGSGVFLGGSYLVYFNGTAAQSIFCSATTRFFHLQFANPASVTLLSDVYLNGNWTNNGGFIANGYTVYFSGSALQLVGGTALTQFHHLTILSGASVQITRAITMLGNWTCGGLFLPNNFNVTFAGTVAQIIGGAVVTPFYGIIINNPVSVTLAQDIRVRGGWVNNGVFIPATYTVYFDGAVAQLIGGSATTTFHHLQILNTVGVTLSGPVFVKGNWLNNGLFLCAGQLVTFNGTALQTIAGTVSTIFQGITCNNAVGVALGQDIRVRGDFTNLALFTAGGYVVYFDGSIAQGIHCPSGTLTFHDVVFANNLGVTLHNGIFLTGHWTNNGGFLHNGQLVTFKGSSLTQLIGGSVASVFHHLTIASGASVQQNLGIALLGNWVNNGSFLHNSLLVYFNGTALQTIGGSALTTFYDVTFNNAVNVSLAHDIDVVRHFVNQGGFCGCGFNTRFNGTVPQTITCSSGRTNFHDLTFANATGVTMLNNVAVSGLWVNNGGFIANGQLIVFNGTALQTIGGSVLSVFHHLQNTNASTAGLTLIRDIHVKGSWTNNGHYCGCGFATVFNGSAAQALTCTTGQSNFHHLTLANTSAGGVTLTGNINVSGNWLQSGIWAPQTYMVFFNGTSGQTISVGGSSSQAIFHGLTIANTNVAGVTLGVNTPLIIRGSFANNGVFFGGTNTVFAAGTTAQTFGGTSPTKFYDWTIQNPAGVSCTGTGGTATLPALGIQHVLTMTTGSGNLACGGHLTLLSTAGGTAMVVNQAGGGECTGEATMERFITGVSSPGYRHYASPMKLSAAGISTTVQEFADDLPVFNLNPAYNTQGNTVTPFPTVFKYAESRVSSSFNNFDRGWMVPTATEDLQPLRGYTAQTDATTVVDIRGVLQNGPVTYTTTRGGVSESGWELIGNPYPAPIDWDVVRATPGMLSGVADAIYVHKPTGRYTGTYASYINGVGQNGGSKDLASMQGFFVRATAATGSVSFSNAVRHTSYVSPVFNRQAPATTARPVVRLEARTATGLADETVLYFEAGAGLGVSPRHDAYKVQLNADGRPSLWSVSGSESLSINGLPDLATAPSIPLGVRVSTTGQHTLVLTGLEGVPTGTQVWLEDKVLNRRQNLATNGSYVFMMDARYTGQRFYLNFVAAASPLATTTKLDARTALYPNPTTGKATLELSGLREQGAVKVDVVNALGQVVLNVSAKAQQGVITQTLDLSSLPTGIYSVRVHAQEGTVVKRLVKE